MYAVQSVRCNTQLNAASLAGCLSCICIHGCYCSCFAGNGHLQLKHVSLIKYHWSPPIFIQQ